MSAQARLGRARLAVFRVVASALLLAATAEVLLALGNIGRPFIEPKPLGTLVPIVLACAAAAIASVTGLTLVWRAAYRPSARALAWFLGFLALFWASTFFIVFVDDDAAGLPSVLAAIREAAPYAMNVAMWLMPAAFLRFSALFPRPLTRDDLDAAPARGPAGGAGRRRKAARVVRRVAGALAPAGLRAAFANRRTRPLRAFRRALLDPGPVWAAALFFGVGPVALLAAVPFLRSDSEAGQASWLPGLAGALFSVFFVLLMVFVLPCVIVLAAKNLRLSYALTGPADRRRIRWVVDGCVIGVGSLFANPFLESAVDGLGLDHAFYQGLPTTLLTGGTLVMVLCLAVGIFYDGALDPALIVRRNALYAAFGVLLTFLFAGVESLVSSHLTERLGLPASTGTFIGGGAVALAFGPLRKPLARLAERWSAGRAEDVPKAIA